MLEGMSIFSQGVCGYAVEGPGGMRKRIGPGGLLLGRGSDCSIQLWDHRVSLHHALIRSVASGLVLLPLGRNATLLNGAPISRAQSLSVGDRVGLPGVELVVVRSGRVREPWSRWAVKPPGSRALLRPEAATFTIGGGDDDDVHIPGWPPAAVQAGIIRCDLLLTCAVEAHLDGEPVEPGALVEAVPGAELEIGGRTVRLLLHQGTHGTTTLSAREELLPSEIRCSFLPTGGLLQLRFREDWIDIELSELRFSLIILLLRPGRGHEVGGFVPDDIVIPGIWPSQSQKDHTDLNLLLHRVRKNLLDAGVNPFQLIERPKKGYATRFRVHTSTDIRIE
jgi:hypothetical protein